MAQPLWSSGCPMEGLKQAENKENAFLPVLDLTSPIGQPDDHIG